MTSAAPRLLLDEHLHLGAAIGLRRLGMDVVHATEVGLAGKADPVLLDRSIDEGRIVVTRDYRGFLALVFHRDTEFPGLLLVPSSIPEGDPGALMGAIRAWAEHRATSGHASTGTVEWLAADFPRSAPDRDVRERPPAYLRALRRIGAQSHFRSRLAPA